MDGDALSLLTDQVRTVRIRLSDIDAPERAQSYGKAATLTLRQLVGGHRIVARMHSTDRYGRAVARVEQPGVDVNAEMVRRGAAWAFARYQTDGRFAMREHQA